MSYGKHHSLKNKYLSCQKSSTNIKRMIIITGQLLKIIGGILTVDANEKMLSCEIGYTINPKFRNKGYASEALKRVLDFLLIEVEYNRIQAGHLADNPASGRVMEKAGMKYEGTLRQDNRNHEGILTNSKVYGILREDMLQ